jgi:D-aspartate ligase
MSPLAERSLRASGRKNRREVLILRKRSGTAPAVVVGLDCITGLQTARILAARGVPVIGVASDPGHFCCRTRAVQEVITADTEGPGLIAALEFLGSQMSRPAVLIPCTDASVLQIARARDRLAGPYRVVLPEADVLLTLQDKIRFVRFAKSIGLPVPATFLLHTRAEAEQAALALTYPCILKPTVRTARWQSHSTAKVYRVGSQDELLALYDRCSAWADELIVQEWIDGGDSELFSCNCYLDRQSIPKVWFVARKLRQWPPRIGVSCLGEECRNDTVRDYALQIFQKSGYQGLAYLEVKRDAKTGQHYLIEANPGRPTGRSAIAEAGGVDLLLTVYRDALGLPLPRTRTQKFTGAKWIFWRQDLRSALYYWRNGELSVSDWLRSLRGPKACAVFSWKDPFPFAWDIASTLMRATGIPRDAQAEPSRATRNYAVVGDRIAAPIVATTMNVSAVAGAPLQDAAAPRTASPVMIEKTRAGLKRR